MTPVDPTPPIPSRPSEVTSTWLSGVLAVEVASVNVVPVGTGQTGATYRLTVTYASHQHDLPATFVIKLPSQADTVRAGVTLGYLSEVAFYAKVAGYVAVPTPKCFYSEITPDGSDFALLLADMSPAVQGDQIAGATAEEAHLAVAALAGLHGPSWGDRRWLDLAEVVMPKPGDIGAAKGIGDVARMAADMTLHKLGTQVSAEDAKTTAAAMDLVTPWHLTAPDRFALMHGDYRADNLLFDPGRARVTVVDWQTMGVGLPARDLAFFTATSLAPDLRSSIERELVDAYHRSLSGHGVTNYSRETCWRDYRLGMLQAPLITTLGCAFAASTERGDEMMAVMLRRGCQAIRELETLELIAQLSPGAGSHR